MTKSKIRLDIFPTLGWEQQEYAANIQAARAIWKEPLLDLSYEHQKLLDFINSKPIPQNIANVRKMRGIGVAAGSLSVFLSTALQGNFSASSIFPLFVASAGLLSARRAKANTPENWQARKDERLRSHQKAHDNIYRNIQFFGIDALVLGRTLPALEDFISPLTNISTPEGNLISSNKLGRELDAMLKDLKSLPAIDLEESAKSLDRLALSLKSAIERISELRDHIDGRPDRSLKQARFKRRSDKILPVLRSAYGLVCKERNTFENLSRGQATSSQPQHLSCFDLVR